MEAVRIPEAELEALAGMAAKRRHLKIEGQLREQADTLTRGQADAVAEIIRQLASVNRKAVGSDAGSSSSNRQADDESAQDYTKVTSLFGSGRQLHGVEGTDEDDEEIASQDKPEGVPPHNTRDDD